ncbi:HpcH/HpaI aldolase family protein [Salipiger abyssi]|uniref:HpcH/HpaI aldolase family protein n=1 Tax=Salipiger abyssi TaxID=1250539 RepID=UPI001A90815A|nr:HpcH/HpaI aldolase/citrate lyase family protein [Salipiger abyssi]MBN9888901.1 HpcH/HpaI aldolase/citrate lyase family protein [Salipiger abyssi]
MDDHENAFKQAIKARRPQVGLWLALASGYTAELCGGCGYDWYVIDCEHSPNTITTVVAQLQALKGCGGEPVVRIPVDDLGFLKQVTDAGCRTVLAPMVESADQARALAEAMCYPPQGRRGVGSSLARGSGFGADKTYLKTANERACLLVQVETVKGLEALEEICAVDGVDGVFIGTADLAADMGYLGQPVATPVQEAMLAAAKTIADAGLPVGALTSDTALAQSYLDAGLVFVAVGNDVSVLRAGLVSLRQSFAPS